jgi:signal transduction histidine kinase
MHRRQVWLFVLVVLLPSAILVALGIRMLSQERELTGKRVADDQKRLAEDARRDILRRIAELPHDASWEPHALDESRILAFRGKRTPWEANRDQQIGWRLLREPSFLESINEDDFVGAIAVAHHPAQRAYAKLKMAAQLASAGRTSEALQIDLEVLRTPGLLVDDAGVPFRIRAAAQLTAGGVMQQAVTDLLREELATFRPMPPAEIQLCKQIVQGLSRHQPSATDAHVLGARLDDRASYAAAVKQALALPVNPAIWHTLGDEYMAMRDKDESVMVRLRPLVTTLPGSILIKHPSEGYGLNPEFPDLSLTLDPSVDRSVTQRWTLLWWFYMFALLLVLGVSLFGGYLLWRDVNRDMKMAEERSQFIAGVSHELRTPLTAIRMYAETLAMGRADSPEVSKQYIETILTEGERLSRLVDNVLDFAKIEQGKRLYRFRRCSLQEVVRTAVQTLERPLAEQGFTVKMDIDAAVPELQADSDALMRAVLNLLSNAMKYSGKSREIDVRLAVRRQLAVIRIRDHGFGLPESEQEQIFEKFYRAPQPDGQSVPGTGLGLTLVKHVAEEHGGGVEVKSAPGEGSTFSLVLPLDRERDIKVSKERNKKEKR